MPTRVSRNTSPKHTSEWALNGAVAPPDVSLGLQIHLGIVIPESRVRPES